MVGPLAFGACLTKLADAAAASAGHCSDSPIGTQTGFPQQVPTTHSASGPQSVLLAQDVSVSQAVLPGTQSPPPSATVVHTQSGLELLHGTKVLQVAPRHPEFGLIHVGGFVVISHVYPTGQHWFPQHGPISFDAQVAFGTQRLPFWQSMHAGQQPDV